MTTSKQMLHQNPKGYTEATTKCFLYFKSTFRAGSLVVLKGKNPTLVFNQPYPTVMSKMLEPTELETAMSPSPLRATMTLVMRSGMEVPAANIVRPIISSVIPMVSPT